MKQDRSHRHRVHLARFPMFWSLARSHLKHARTHTLTAGHGQFQKRCLRVNMSSLKQMPISSVAGTGKKLARGRKKTKHHLLFLTEPIIPTGVTWVLKKKNLAGRGVLLVPFSQNPEASHPPRAQSSLQVVSGWLTPAPPPPTPLPD